MSLILEALNRSQRERQADNGPPGLDTPAYIDGSGEQRRWRSTAIWLALLAALLLVGLLGFNALTRDPPPGKAPARSGSQLNTVASEKATKPDSLPQLQPKPVPKPAPKRAAEVAANPAPKVSRPAVQPASTDTGVAALYDKQSEALPIQPEPDITSATVVAEPNVKPATTEKPTTELRVTEQPINIEDVLARTEEALKTARLQEHAAPFITDLSQQKKDEIPSIMYSHHDFSTNSSQSAVVLNGKTLKTGQKLTAGMKLDEILPDSIVLSHRGEQFRLRALNSWVNL